MIKTRTINLIAASLISAGASADDNQKQWFLKSNVLACDSKEHYEDQIQILQQGAYIINDGCGSTTRRVQIVVLDLNMFGPSKVKAIEGGPVLWVDQRSIELTSATPKIKPKESKSQPFDKKRLAGFPPKNICRAAISMIMFREPKIMKFDKEKPGEVFIHYIRKDDKSRWDYKCKINGNKVLWAVKQPEGWGRWRTEDVITFSIQDNGKKLSMTVKSDGSKPYSDVFNQDDFPKN